MPDKMPFDVLGKLFVLGFHLLSVILAESPVSVLVQQGNIFRRVEFGDGDQSHASGQGSPDFVVFFDIHTDCI